MDTAARLTGRQKRRRLKYGLPVALRAALLLVLAVLLVGFGLGFVTSAHAIGTIQTTAEQGFDYKLCKSWSTPKEGAPATACFQGTPAEACGGMAGQYASDFTYSEASQYGKDWVTTATVTVATTQNCTFTYSSTFTYKPAAGCVTACTGTTNNSYSSGYTVLPKTNQVCTGGSIKVGSSCVCPLGTKPNPPAATSGGDAPSTSTCTAYVCEKKPFGETAYTGGGVTVGGTPLTFNTPLYRCDTANSTGTGARADSYGCSSTLELKMVGQVEGETNKTYWYSETQNGKPCQGESQGVSASTAASGVETGTGVKPAPGNTPCKMGTCPGTVNGASVCVACSQTTAGGATGSTTAASGVGSASGVPGTNSTTNIESTRQTVCANGYCVTTTVTAGGTTTSGGGNSTETTTSSSTQTQSEFCAQNPGSPLCAGKGSGEGGEGEEGEGGGFGGTCEGGFTCSGEFDAITCAIATEQHRRECEFWGTQNDGTAKNLGLAAFTAGATPEDHPGNAANIESKALGSFDQTDLIAGGCPADLAVPMPYGPAVSLKLSQLCTPAAWLGNLLVGITALSCLVFVFRGT